MNFRKAPFPWFGGKSRAAPAVWAALGDVEHYVEPFCGSLAVLLNRPHVANRPYHSETVNDIDGLLVNAWRAIQLRPDETAEAASNPVAEADLHARHAALVRWRTEEQLEHLMGDPSWCDPVMAGWWLWGVSCWIGSGFASGEGSWRPDETGRLRKGNAGVSRKLPSISDDGRGVNRQTLREPGVKRQRPHLAGDGQGVAHASLREPGVHRKLPSISDDGRGVASPALREPGVPRQLPHLSNNGQGVAHAALREPGVRVEDDYHPVTMPLLREWFRALSARLRHVRILNGDWQRACTTGALKTLSVRKGGLCGVFLDPPYADTAARDKRLYAHDSATVAHAVREWCLAHGDDSALRIVLAGFDGEHGTALADAGWSQIEWFTSAWLTGGMGNANRTGSRHQQHRERLWLSPHCLRTVPSKQSEFLFGEAT